MSEKCEENITSDICLEDMLIGNAILLNLHPVSFFRAETLLCQNKHMQVNCEVIMPFFKKRIFNSGKVCDRLKTRSFVLPSLFQQFPSLVSEISRNICILVVRNIWGRSAKYNLRFLDENYAHVLAIFCISVFINLEFCI